MSTDGLLPGELPPPEPPPERSQRADEILATARTLLQTEGAEALTMRRLAERLGLQAPSLYKHFSSKAALEAALVSEGMRELGLACHRALHEHGREGPLVSLLLTYRRYALAESHLYRLATAGRLPREQLPAGLEEWAGNPWFVVTGDPSSAQALWSFAHGMVILELDDRYPPGSDLEATWQAGATAFSRRRQRSARRASASS